MNNRRQFWVSGWLNQAPPFNGTSIFQSHIYFLGPGVSPRLIIFRESRARPSVLAVNHSFKMEERGSQKKMLANGAYTWMEGRNDKEERPRIQVVETNWRKLWAFSDHHATKNIFLLLKNNCLQDYSVFISQYEVLVHLKRRALIWLNPHIRIGGSYKIRGFSLFKQNCNPFLVSCHFAQTFNNHTRKRSHLSGPLRGSPNAFWEDARDRLLGTWIQRKNRNQKQCVQFWLGWV